MSEFIPDMRIIHRCLGLVIWICMIPIDMYMRVLSKKFVDWCDEINTYLAMLCKFCWGYKTTNVLLVVKMTARYVDN